MTQERLAVSIRCHRYPYLVLDTLDALLHYTPYSSPTVILSVDGQNKRLSKLARNKYPQILTHTAKTKWKWGPGLYGLLCDTVKTLDHHKVKYDHFLTIDYDTLFISQGLDVACLRMAAEDESVGIIGAYTNNSRKWQHHYKKDKNKVRKLLASNRAGRNVDEMLKNYIPGENVLGAYMWLTRSGMNAMRAHGFFDAPYRDIRKRLSLVDDVWLTLLVKCCGLQVVNVRKHAHIVWKAAFGYRDYLRHNFKAFHPAKVNQSGDVAQEIECRNYFREIRGRKQLSTNAGVML